MNWLGEFARRLRMLIHRRRFDADLEEEIRLHLELRQEEQLKSGMSAYDAQTAARRRFGNTTYLKEESHIAWGWEWFENLAQDVRYAMRTSKKNPAFLTIAVLTLAIGIGANVAIFTLVNAVLLQPLPFREPNHVVRIFDDLKGAAAKDVGMSVPELEDLRGHSELFEQISAIWPVSTALTGGERAERIEMLARTGRLVVWPDQSVGAAVWLLPAKESVYEAEAKAKAEFLAAELGATGGDAYRRIIDFMRPRALAAVAQSAWYLSIIGVTPSAQGQGVGRSLIEPTLVDADYAGVECYLETFDRRNPGFYQRLGFSAVGSHAEPVTGATYTIMRRHPKTRSAQS